MLGATTGAYGVILGVALLSVLAVSNGIAPLSATERPQSGSPTARSGQTSAAVALKGPFTDEQAARGQQVYQRACAECHGDDLLGSDGPALTGPSFSSRWQSIADLYLTVSQQMPEDAPGSMSAQAYADVIGYLLKANGGAAGSIELTVASAAPSRSDASAHPSSIDVGSMPATIAGTSASPQRALVNRYCVTCHNQRVKTAGLMLDALDVDHVDRAPEPWEKVVRKLRAGMMPPAGRPRPDPAARDAFVSWLEAQLDRAAEANPNPGRTEAIHRVNRAEYANAIRDLLALDVDAAALLPADDGSYGFDNMAGALKLSPALLERYVTAARRISRLAVGHTPPSPTADTYRLSPELNQSEHVEGLPFGTRGGILIHYTFPVDADYNIKVALGRAVWEGYSIVGVNYEPQEIEVSVDGVRAKLFTVIKEQKRAKGAAPKDLDADLHVQLPVKAGPHDVTVAFLAKSAAQVEEDLRQPFQKPYFGQVYQAQIGSVTIAGPFHPSGTREATPSRKRIFVCYPVNASQESPCARKILTTMARRAYRGNVTQQNLQALLSMYRRGRASSDFESGIELAIRRLLVSPEFLFRIERDPLLTATGDAPDISATNAYRISTLELASRLSFFLWSSIPDDQLLHVARDGTLDDPAELEKQVRRMLADPRSDALVANFAGQWLYLRNLRAARPDEVLFPNFDEGLRQSFQRETELFIQSIIHEDRSVLDLLSARYTFVNERLAKHYGIPNVYGSEFRRVMLPDDSKRGGLLGEGSILTVTSLANRTSPVQRGKWILANILGTPPPPPPPNVPALEATKGKGKVLSVREQMEQHRANPACATCHKLMDPLGFALENFDAVGQWRSHSGSGGPIDVSAVLPDGSKFNGIDGLRQVLLSRPDQFVSTMTEKLLTYALGRGLEYYDAPAVRRIVHASAAKDYRFSALVLGIVRSIPFQMRRPQS